MAQVLVDHECVKHRGWVHSTTVGRVAQTRVNSLFLRLPQVSSFVKDVLHLSDLLFPLEVLLFNASDPVLVDLLQSVELIHRNAVVN